MKTQSAPINQKTLKRLWTHHDNNQRKYHKEVYCQIIKANNINIIAKANIIWFIR